MKRVSKLLIISSIFSTFTLAGCNIMDMISNLIPESEEENVTERFVVQADDDISMLMDLGNSFKATKGDEEAFHFAKNVTNASVNHRTRDVFAPDYTNGTQGMYKTSLDESPVWKGNNEILIFAKLTLNISDDQEVYFDAELSFGKINGEGAQAAKALRIFFDLPDNSFVYAPFQEEEKCTYVVDETYATSFYGDDLLDKNSNSKMALPQGKVDVYFWFEGTDENCTNETKHDSFELTLAITRGYGNYSFNLNS